jgi:hypothetical protein
MNRNIDAHTNELVIAKATIPIMQRNKEKRIILRVENRSNKAPAIGKNNKLA